ncbi:hypothetical protein Mpe_A0109 [Methylibium petroleiphilum PM1]|uniref:Uncharacterized protein n=2 Tax=Methylibium TaxID=316612 RepID=A2SBY2_METPP|nr:hypothetical protein Mpe_A0109 [Methylibium petroleiphilum PM1]
MTPPRTDPTLPATDPLNVLQQVFGYTAFRGH